MLLLRRAGALVVWRETANTLTFYLAPDAADLLEDASEPSDSANTSPAAARVPRRGRPAWTQELFWTRYRDARDLARPPYTNKSIAPHFELLDGTRGADPDHVRRLVRRFGLPPD